MATTFVFAFCWATGAIDFGRKVPKGAIGFARGPRSTLKDLVAATARLAYDNQTFLVPGVPEAPNERAGLQALSDYIHWLSLRPRPGVMTFDGGCTS